MASNKSYEYVDHQFDVVVVGAGGDRDTIQAEVIDVDPLRRQVILKDGRLNYDSLIVATGVSHHYFGREAWADRAPGLKTVEDALEIRRRILLAFEAAERSFGPAGRSGAAGPRFEGRKQPALGRGAQCKSVGRAGSTGEGEHQADAADAAQLVEQGEHRLHIVSLVQGGEQIQARSEN